MKKFLEFILDPELISFLLFIVVIAIVSFAAIDDIVNTTEETVSLSSELIKKEIEERAEPVYKTVDGEFKFVGYEHKTYFYYNFVLDDNEELRLQVYSGIYDKYDEGDTVPLTKTIRYRKGTDEVKSIRYECKDK